jgi:alkanesulfonate monooxygenase SsuD/methylene tetrahydromethanopterin reductase-like flavin-dependent oxidoreductase (luciferase family)
VTVRAKPVQKPEDIMMVGGGVAASAKRAVRHGVGFGPILPDLVDVYLDKCRSLGQPPGQYFRPGPVPISIHL